MSIKERIKAGAEELSGILLLVILIGGPIYFGIVVARNTNPGFGIIAGLVLFFLLGFGIACASGN